jgi:tRNA-specific 2-thiouridylase
MTKPEVREIAERLGLATAQRKDSQGICFVGKVDLPTFLQQKLKSKKGEIIEIARDSIIKTWEKGYPDEAVTEEELREAAEPHKLNNAAGKVIGDHNGAHFFTIGQRKGINIGGHKEALFVIGLDIDKNILYVGESDTHPGLHRKGLFIKNDQAHWIRPDLEMNDGESRDYLVRIRYRQPLQKARLYKRQSGIYIIFNELQRGIAPGQFAAWYAGDEVIGSGVID